MYYFSVPFLSNFLHLCTSTLTISSQSLRWMRDEGWCNQMDDVWCMMFDVSFLLSVFIFIFIYLFATMSEYFYKFVTIGRWMMEDGWCYKMDDGRWMMEDGWCRMCYEMDDVWWMMDDVIPRHLASYIDAPRFLPILRSRYRENHVAYRSDLPWKFQVSLARCPLKEHQRRTKGGPKDGWWMMDDVRWLM